MKFKKLIQVFICVLLSLNTGAQGISNLWMSGYQSGYIDFGGSNINFINGSPDTSYHFRTVNFSRVAETMCDSSGNLLFYTNGYAIVNRNNDTMANTGLFHVGYYENSYVYYGKPMSQSLITIPKPGNPNHYYIFHECLDIYLYILQGQGASLYPTDLYVSEIDLSLDSGRGSAIYMNQNILHDTLSQGGFTACKHANGRDWWLVIPEHKNNGYYIFLISPAGIQLIHHQFIGYKDELFGHAAFSPDGSKYAYYNWYWGLEIRDFDRCTGLFSNPIHITGIDSMGGFGCAFSPNSEKLYVNSNLFLYQFDLTAPNIAASINTVAVWDGFYEFVPLATLFGYLKLAPDGKIYITTGNTTRYLHVINNPDLPGVACDVQQHAIRIPTFNDNSLPNHPNYFLGSVPGSLCDSLTILSSSEIEEQYGINCFPNPANQQINISLPENLNGSMELIVYNAQGKEMAREFLKNKTKNYQLQTSALSNGIYLMVIKSSQMFFQKFTVVH